MKKLISLLLAVSLMAASTVASAAGLNVTGQRNPGSWQDLPGERNSGALRDYRTTNQLACFRPGDTITFTINQNNIDIGQVGQANYVDNTFKAGDVITFISSIDDDDAALDSSTVMFIDQVVADNASSVSYSYKIRAGLADGRYKMVIKIGDVPVDTYYYGVANPTVEMLDYTEGQQYYIQNDVAYYFAKATLNTNELLFEQVVENFGFDSAVLSATTFPGYHFDEYATADSIEASAATFVFAIGLSDFDGETDLPTVEEYINE